MSLRCAGSQLLQTVPSTLLTGASTVSLSIWVRVNPGSNFANLNGVQLFGDSGGKLAVGLSAVGKLRASWSANDGGADHASSWSQSLVPGVNYHLAVTWQDGAQRYYVNGLLVGSDAQHGVLGKLGDSASHPFRLGSDVAGVDVTLDEPTLWVGYALTAADVGTLRDRVAAPSTISPATIALRWTLAGPDGGSAAPGDLGLTDGSTSRLNLSSVIGGAPTYQSGVLTYSLLDQGCTAMVAPSGQGIVFKFHDAATNPSNVTNVVDNNERQSVAITGQPSGGTFTLTCRGQTTAPIPTIPSPPARYFAWNKTLPAQGTYDLAVNIFVGGSGSPNVLYEVFDGATPLGTFTLNHARADGAFYGGPADPAPFVDPGGVLRIDGAPLTWFPLGRFTFSSTALHLRVSAPGDNVDGRNGFDVDNLRIATTDGAIVTRVRTTSPPATLVANGEGIDLNYQHPFQAADDPGGGNAIALTGQGAGVRYLADPAVIRARLEALSTVGVGNVTVTGDGSAIAPIVITMTGAIGGLAQPLITASDPAINGGVATEVARGGILPAIRINGGAAIPLPRDWLHYYASTPAMPGVAFLFPQWPAAATYAAPRHRDNTTAGNWQGYLPLIGPYAGYTANALISTAPTDTATYLLRPVPYGQYRVGATWLPHAGQSTDVVYTVRDAANNVLGTYHTDQTIAPSGAVDQGVPWQVLGTFTLAGLNDGLFVTQSNGTSAPMVADAVRFERLSADLSLRISDTDVVTYTAGLGWATCQVGSASAATDAPVANRVGGTLYPALPSSASMGVGYNLDGGSGANGTCFYNNLLCFGGIRDLPTTLSGIHDFFYINLPPNPIGSDNRSWNNVPTGDFVLAWDGASDLHIAISGGGTATETGVSNYPAPGGVGNRRHYTFGGDAFGYGPGISLEIRGTTIIGSGPTWNADVRNAGLYPAGVDPATAPKFRANFLARFAGMKSIRFMGSMGAIDSNPTEISDYNPPAGWLTKDGPVRTLTRAVAEIRQYTGPEYHLDPNEGVMFLITTSSPHGFAANQLVQFVNSSPYTVTFSNDLGHTTTFDFDGPQGFVYPLTSTTFMWYLGPHAEKTGPEGAQVAHPYSMLGVVTNPPTTVTLKAGCGFPLRDTVDLCNAVGADFHANIAFSASDQCCTDLGTFWATHLDPGLKLRLACSNEVWNYFNTPYRLAAAGSFAFYGGSSSDPFPFTCETAHRQWRLVEAAWVAAGRSIADVIRVMEGQYFDSGKTNAIATYCRDHGINFHEFAVAPYLGNNPSFVTGYQAESRFGPTVDRMTVAQQIDMWDYHYTYGRYEREMPTHRASLDSFGFPDVKLIAYEGGPQTMSLGGGSGLNLAEIGHAFIRSPRWYGLYQHILRVLQDSGCTLFQDFQHGGADANPGNSYAQWSAYSVTDQPVYVPGDPVQDAIQVNQFDRLDLVHSVTGGALKHWGSMYLSSPSSPPPPPPPPPTTTTKKPMRLPLPRRYRPFR